MGERREKWNLPFLMPYIHQSGMQLLFGKQPTVSDNFLQTELQSNKQNEKTQKQCEATLGD